jgi:hypothetical protein
MAAQPRLEGDHMKGKIVVAACVGLALGAMFARAEPAVSADPTNAKIAALQKQVRTLQAQMKTVQRNVTNLRGQLALNFEGDTCLGAQTADLLQGTWGIVDQVAGRTIFGPQSPVSDFNNCADLAQPDVPRPGIRVPPTIEPLRPLLQWLHEDLG